MGQLVIFEGVPPIVHFDYALWTIGVGLFGTLPLEADSDNTYDPSRSLEASAFLDNAYIKTMLNLTAPNLSEGYNGSKLMNAIQSTQLQHSF